MPQHVKSAGVEGGKREEKPQRMSPDLAALLGEEAPSLQGLVATREDEQALLDALEKAFDYRGDVTLWLADGQTVEGYIFDRRKGAALADARVRLLCKDEDEPRAVAFSDIAMVEFSGKDAAHGKSFETWLKKYVQRKLAQAEQGADS